MISTTFAANIVYVESSTIRAVAYRPKASELFVEFKNGGQYIYFGVAKKTFNEFIEADSKGQYFAQNIKDHEFQKISD